jgi:hypothetical protein
MSTKIDTPRTQALLFHRDSGEYEDVEYVVTGDAAIALERELNAARAELAALKDVEAKLIQSRGSLHCQTEFANKWQYSWYTEGREGHAQVNYSVEDTPFKAVLPTLKAEPQPTLHPDAPNRELTLQKVESIMQRGYQITGFMLLSEHGHGIVDMSAVRWLTKDEWWKIMHEAEPQPVPLDRPDKVWIVTRGNWGSIDSVWDTKEGAWKRAEQIPEGGYVTCPSSYVLQHATPPPAPSEEGVG